MRSQAPSFEIGDKLHIELTHVETRNVLAVQIDHVGVRNAAIALRFNPCEALALKERRPGHQTVIRTVEPFDQRIREIQRELAGGRMLQA